MRVNVAQSPPPYTLSPHRTTTAVLSLSNPTPKTRLTKPISATFNGHDFPYHHNHFTSKPNIPSFRRHVDTDVELLEPSILGIRPEPLDWPARDAVIRECIARRANSIDIPLSLRMISMKQKLLKFEEEIRVSDFDDDDDDSLRNLCCSMLGIIREVQICAIKSRGVLLDEVLGDGVVLKLQRELNSSFVWLFKEVFAKTPEFMIHLMVLTSNFVPHSLQCFDLLVEDRELEEKREELGVNSVSGTLGLVDGGDGVVVVVVKEEELRRFESSMPVVGNLGTVEIEKDDDYEEYHRTELFYQIGLFQDPNNTLLLSNYAQFLCLVSRNYDRAEECFKRAITLDESDAEVISLYANFLWVVRKDLWGAEKRFQQAVAAEPDNSYHTSKYASFLWSTGGEETCYPIDPPRGNS